jgi:hypothetical protein
MIRDPTHSLSIDGYLKHGEPAHLDISIHNQFAMKGVWLRGSLHVDVDKENPAPDVSASACHWYRRHGFDFIAVQNTIAAMGADVLQDGFLPILGAEKPPGHTVVVNVDWNSLPDLNNATMPLITRTTAFIKAIDECGGLAIVAHPFWTGWSWKELTQLLDAGAAGIEVTNGNWRHAANWRSDQIWGMLLNAGYRPVAIGADDCQQLGDDRATASWTGMLASERSVEAILAAIRDGRTYASEGPRIRRVSVEESGGIVVECSPCRACSFLTWGPEVDKQWVSAGSTGRERFELDLAAKGYRIHGYLVIVLEDFDCNRAWTSAMDVEVAIRDI